MPTYEYIYTDVPQDTIEKVEIFHSMKDEPLTIHPENGRPIQKIISLPNIVIDSKQPKTIGALADKNTQEMMKRGDPRVRPKKKKERPFWRPNKDKPVSVRGKTPQQIEKYIMTGKE